MILTFYGMLISNFYYYLMFFQDLQAVRVWLDDLIEDQLEVSDEFKAKIQRAQAEIAQGVHSRVRP